MFVFFLFIYLFIFSGFMAFSNSAGGFSSFPMNVAAHEVYGSQYRTRGETRREGLWLC